MMRFGDGSLVWLQNHFGSGHCSRVKRTDKDKTRESRVAMVLS